MVLIINLCLQILLLLLGMALFPLLLVVNIVHAILKKNLQRPFEVRIPGPRLYLVNRNQDQNLDNLRNLVIRGDDDVPEVVVNNIL